MKFLFVTLATLWPLLAQSQVLNMYQVNPGHSQPVLLENHAKVQTSTGREKRMNLRIKMTKYVITKTQQGPKVNFSPVCEIDVQIPIEDLTSGGIISENTLGVCESKYNGKQVAVVVSGMVYDSTGFDFSDESDGWMRNFFAHLSLSSSEIIFGLGDFNLDTTRDSNFNYLSSALSVDPQLGATAQQREGFTARIRYQPN